jgi:hypothetical protein
MGKRKLIFSELTWGLVEELGRDIRTKVAVYRNQMSYEIVYTYAGKGNWSLFKSVEREERAREEVRGLIGKLTRKEAYFSKKELKFRD